MDFEQARTDPRFSDNRNIHSVQIMPTPDLTNQQAMDRTDEGRAADVEQVHTEEELAKIKRKASLTEIASSLGIVTNAAWGRRKMDQMRAAILEAQLSKGLEASISESQEIEAFLFIFASSSSVWICSTSAALPSSVLSIAC